MPLIKLDFTDLPSAEPLPKGKYGVVVEEVKMIPAKDPSDPESYPYLAWKFSITAEGYEGRRLSMNTSLAPKALWNLQGTLTAVGIRDDQLEITVDDETGFVTSPSLVGQPSIAQVGQEMYQNRVRNTIEFLEPIPQPVVVPSTPQAPAKTVQPAASPAAKAPPKLNLR